MQRTLLGSFSKMRGWGFKELKKHPDLIPVFLCPIFSAVMCFGMCIRALYHPDVCIIRRPNLEIPNEEFRNKQWKFWTTADCTTKNPDYWPKPGDGLTNPYEGILGPRKFPWISYEGHFDKK